MEQNTKREPIAKAKLSQALVSADKLTNLTSRRVHIGKINAATLRSREPCVIKAKNSRE